MSHRAEQVVDAAQSRLQAHALLAGVNVLQHRVLSLSSLDQELPAVSITLGDDEPLDEDGSSNLAFFDSQQTLIFRIVVKGEPQDDEQHVISALQNLRRSIHVALMVDDSLALAFVIGTRYGGADAPQLEVQDEHLTGILDCRWLVHYRMNIADPS